MPRLTYFQWTEVAIGKIQAVTPKEGEAPVGPITDADHIKRILRIPDAESAKDQRPLLIYFHWPHDDATHGKLSLTICSKVLNDEGAARWSQLFRCVQVDMGNTEIPYAEMIGSEGKPAFVALGNDLEVKARIDATKSGSKLRKALEKAFYKFPGAKKKLKATLAEHRKMLAKAEKLEKADEYEDALELVDEIRFGNVRVADDWDRTYQYGMALALKAERELERSGR
jgi:hypothetical protein